MLDHDGGGAADVHVVPEQHLRVDDVRQLQVRAVIAEVDLQRERLLRGQQPVLRHESVRGGLN